MKTLRTATLLTLISLMSSLPALAEPITFNVTPGGDNEVVFVSKAVGETFDGRTDQISGSFSCDLDNLNAPVSGAIEIDVKSLDTGIKLRNNHMLKNHLQPDEYPTMAFALEEIAECPAMIVSGEAHTIKARGKFTCHGVTRDIEPDLTLTLNKDGSLSVMAEWIVNLNDYEIPRPQFLFVKLAEDQEVSASFTAFPQSGGSE
jgi:polyisoprenoid-binding protein YceI